MKSNDREKKLPNEIYGTHFALDAFPSLFFYTENQSFYGEIDMEMHSWDFRERAFKILSVLTPKENQTSPFEKFRAGSANFLDVLNKTEVLQLW